MDERYFIERQRDLARIRDRAVEKKIEWLYRILFLCATLFGVLISLLPKTPDNLLHRLCLGAGIVLLVFGLAGIGLTLYSLYKMQQDAARQASEELQNAIREWRTVSDSTVHQSKKYVRIEKFGYMFLLASLFFLALSVFF